MSESLLLQSFDLLATAPGGVARLRELILTLAVQGQLVKQDPNDEDARALLKKICIGKDNLISRGTFRRDKSVERLAEADEPFQLPKGWLWTPLQHLGFTQTGTTPDKKTPAFFGSHVPFVKPGDIYVNHVDYENEGLTEIGLVDSGRLAPAGSILMVCIGTIGKCNLITRDCSFNQQINSITPLSGVHDFLHLYMRSPTFQNEAWRRSNSTTIAILNKGNWETIPIALPPLVEQFRIVTRVKELMKLCDSLEQNRRLADEQHAHLTSTLFGALAASESDHAQAENWQRVAESFDLLLDRPEAVDALEQTILQMAVRGLLVIWVLLHQLSLHC